MHPIGYYAELVGMLALYRVEPIAWAAAWKTSLLSDVK